MKNKKIEKLQIILESPELIGDYAIICFRNEARRRAEKDYIEAKARGEEKTIEFYFSQWCNDLRFIWDYKLNRVRDDCT